MKKRFKFLSFVLAFILAAGLFAFPGYAAEEEAAGQISVTVRAESSMPGNDKTMLSTLVTLEEGAATVLDAVIAASDGAYEVSEGDYGAFLTSLIGVSDETGAYSWMYAVNNELAEVSVDAYELQAGDKIDFYFVSWQDADYSYFDQDVLAVNAGEKFTLNLTGVDFTDGEYPVEGAMITTLTDSPLTRNLYYTDADGNVTLSFFAAGEYLVSASLLNDNGVETISRPLCVVSVGEGAEPQPSEPPVDSFDSLDNIEPMPIPTVAPDFDLTNIEPMPMPTPAVTYGADTNTLNVYGKDVNLTGLTVMNKDGELYLPLRAVAEALGKRVSWDGETSTVLIADADLASSVGFTVSVREGLENNTIEFYENHVYVPTAFVILHFGE